jgi:hypothetical protein
MMRLCPAGRDKLLTWRQIHLVVAKMDSTPIYSENLLLHNQALIEHHAFKTLVYLGTTMHCSKTVIVISD